MFSFLCPFQLLAKHSLWKRKRESFKRHGTEAKLFTMWPLGAPLQLGRFLCLSINLYQNDLMIYVMPLPFVFYSHQSFFLESSSIDLMASLSVLLVGSTKTQLCSRRHLWLSGHLVVLYRSSCDFLMCCFWGRSFNGNLVKRKEAFMGVLKCVTLLWRGPIVLQIIWLFQYACACVNSFILLQQFFIVSFSWNISLCNLMSFLCHYFGLAFMEASSFTI